jgi:hypothetical protein
MGKKGANMKSRKQAICMLALAAASTYFTAGAYAQVNRDIYSYVLFAYDSLEFQGGNTNANPVGFSYITGGNVGVNYPVDFPGRPHISAFSLAFGTSNHAIMSDGSQAVADSVTDGGAHKGNFYDLYANTLSPSFASTIRNGGTNITWSPTPIIAPATLAALFPFAPGRASTSNATLDVTVGSGETTNFAAGTYGIMDIKKDATVTFGAGTFDIRNLKMGSGVTINVDDNTILQIDEAFDPGDNLKFGLGTSAGAHIYVGAVGFNVTTERVSNFAKDSEIHAQYFAPTGWLDIGGGNELFGRYWAQRISGDPNNNVTIPEPSTLALVGTALVGLIAFVLRRTASAPPR